MARDESAEAALKRVESTDSYARDAANYLTMAVMLGDDYLIAGAMGAHAEAQRRAIDARDYYLREFCGIED